MAAALRHMILVTQNVRFAIEIKRALEERGDFQVTTAASARNAIDFLREQSADLLLLDTDDLPIAPDIMIDLARARAADIAIVLAPDRPELRQLAVERQLAGVVDMPVLARALLPILQAALARRPQSLPPLPATAQLPSQDTLAIESLVDDVVGEEAALSYTRRRLQASYELLNPPQTSEASTERTVLEVQIAPADDADTVRFHTLRIADELDESTLASADGDTVRDLARRLSTEQSGQALPSDPSPPDPQLEDSAAFQDLLNTLLDESTQLDDLKLESLFDTTREFPGAPGSGAVPRWLREADAFIDEPSFLQDILPRLEAAPADTTAPVPPDTEVSPPPQPAPSPPAPQLDEETIPSAHLPELEETAQDEAWLPLSSQDKDPLTAQLALTMTQSMTELTADASVLTRGNRIHAFSGELPLEKFRALRQVIADDWAAPGDNSRLRFIRLPESSADYMLYSRGTIAGYCLTLIFAGGRELRDIRQQGDSLLQALRSAPTAAPDADAAPESAPAPDAPKQPFAFVWLLAEPGLPLRKPVAEQLLFWLEVQLNSLGWTIHRLDVHGDFVYLYADVPGDAAPDALIRNVMERSRQIACAEDAALPKQLWADAYLVLQPGRAMSERELGSFLQFARS